MSKNPLIFIILRLLIQLLVKVNCQRVNPENRHFHTSTLIDNKLYVLGGEGDLLGTQFYYIDMSIPFNTRGLLWNNLTSKNTVPHHFAAAAVRGGRNNNTLFLYGGVTTNASMALVYEFDIYSELWSTPVLTGEKGVRRDSLEAVIYNEKMYLFGGLYKAKGVDLNEMLVFDTITFDFTKASTVDAPTPRRNYAATLLPNQQILYLGGIEGSNQLPLNEAYFYDITNDSWSRKTLEGKVPSNREAFSTVLGLDGQRVIIFGGTEADKIPVPSRDALYVLDLKNMKWFIPNVSGQPPNPRYWHKANVVGTYMVVSFGRVDPNSGNDLLLLDISNDDEYKWTNNYEPITSSASELSPQTSSNTLSPTTSPFPPSSNTKAIIGAVIGSFIGVVALSVGGFLLYRWNQNGRAIPTP